MDRNQFTDTLGCCSARICGSLDRTYITAYHHGYVPAANVFGTDQVHIGSLDHRIRGFNRTNEAFCLDHAESNQIGI
jgi:hypothetical protein